MADKPNSPTVFIPVTAEDEARRKRRIWLSICAGALAVLAIAGLLYKNWTDPLHAKESYDAGVRYLRAARYDQAILAFDRATSLQSSMADAYLMRARAYTALSRTENAIRDFTRVIDLRPSDAQAMLERGQAYLESKDYPSALADANRAIDSKAQFAAAYNLRGQILRLTGNPQKALEDFTRAVQIAPNADNYFQRAATYQAMGEHRLAIEDFDEVIAYQPDESPAYFARAESRRAVGDLGGAKADHDRGRIIDGR